MIGRATRMKLTQRTQHILTAYLFIFPGLALYLVFNIYPIVKAFQMSFYEWSIMPGTENEFVGLANYGRALADPIVGLSLRNTIVYTLVTVVGQMVLALLAALLLNHIVRGKIFFRTLYYLPVVTSWVIVSLLFKYLFQSPNGLVNHVLENILHVIDDPIPWLRVAKTAMVPIWSLGIWKGVGWSMVIFLAALQTIPSELYEVAAIDGAGIWQRFTHITLPLIRPTLVFTLVMLMIGGFNVFISVALITNGGPLQRTEVMLSYMYHQAFDFLDFGYGAALSFILAIIIVTVSFLQIRFLREPEPLS
ncbi:MAG: sugar ABC transporter permease [Anaerolineales bacterium]|nr:sugar ABC transporter permease [Anaerolineales bacterium]